MHAVILFVITNPSGYLVFTYNSMYIVNNELDVPMFNEWDLIDKHNYYDN